MKRVEEWCEVRQLGHRRKPPQRRAAIDLVVSVPKIEAHDHELGLRAKVGSHAVYEDIQAAGDTYCHLVGCQVVGERACGLGVHTRRTVQVMAHIPTSPTATGRALFLLRQHRA